MKFKIIALVISTFFSLFKLKNTTNFFNFLREQYDEQHVKIYRKLISDSKKLEKVKLDLDFLLKCKTYDVTPKFLRFKLYKKSLHAQQFYKSWLVKLLNFEISFKRKRISELNLLIQDNTCQFNKNVHFLVQLVAANNLKKFVQSYISRNRIIQNKKLEHLGIFNDLVPVNPFEVVHNYSSIKIPERIQFLLAFGLQFNLPIFKIDFYKFFHPLEKIAFSLNHESCHGDKKEFFDKMKFCVNKFYYGFKSSRVFSPIFGASDIGFLRSFARDNCEKIVVSKPDKGHGVVIVDKSSYLCSMEALISDSTKFSPISTDISKWCTKIEDKINRFLGKLKSMQLLSQDVYAELYSTGSGPGILYGLPKIHKSDFSTKYQYRPILAAFKLASFNICKFFVPLLAPLTTNEFTIENSSAFASFIQSVPNANQLFMTSFDVENLFTNIPLQETIQICLDSLFRENPTFLGFTKALFRSFLELAVNNTFFLFNNNYYQQTEGVGMGLPLGPTFANIFMCDFERKHISSCPSDFKPIFYKRYVDDTFILFRDPSHAPIFLNYINSKHCNIKFTMEKEQNYKLSFLDVSVERSNNHFNTSVFRKDVFSGMGMSFFSYCCKIFKINSVKTLLNRAYNISSNYFNLNAEFQFLINFFHSNGYPKFLIENLIHDFLNKKYMPKQDVSIVPRKPVYFSMLYFGHKSVIFKIKLIELIEKYFPHLDFHIILVNPYTTGSFFKFKDSLPKFLCSSLVYKFSCVKNNCTSEYYGFTTRRLSTRVAEHRGTSARTSHLLVHPSFIYQIAF